MKKSVCVLSVLIISLVFMLALVSADETYVTVKGLKGYVFNITLNVINPSSGNLIASIENDTNPSTGIADFRYSSAAQTVTYYVIARSNGRIVGSRNSASIGNYSTGPGVTAITLFPETTPTTRPAATIPVTPVVNQSEINTTSTTTNTTTIDLGSSFSLSGTFGKISSALRASWKWIIYGIVILLAIGAITWGVIWWMRQPKKVYDFTKKSGDLVMPGDNERQVSHGNRKIEDELANAEQKIKEAQEEINRIKNRKSKFDDAKQKYEQAKRDLEDAKEEIEDEF